MHIETTRREIFKSGGALVVCFSLAGAFEQAVAQGAGAKPVALNEVEFILGH